MLVLVAWIFMSKMVKMGPYFLEDPKDLVFVPRYSYKCRKEGQTKAEISELSKERSEKEPQRSSDTGSHDEVTEATKAHAALPDDCTMKLSRMSLGKYSDQSRKATVIAQDILQQ